VDISVVIPTFNRKEKVLRAVKSVTNQTYKHLEVIVVDDHSTDKTREAIRSIEDDRVQCVINKRSKGAQGARNTGVEIADGEWIAFLDSDDVWRKEKLEKQVEYVNGSEEVVYSICSNVERRKSGNVFWESDIGRGEINESEKFLYSNPIGGCFSSYMVKKEVIKSVGGLDENLSAFQDRDIYYRVCKSFNIHKIEKKLVKIDVDSGDRISEEGKVRMDASIDFYRKYKPKVKSRNILYCMKADIAHYAALNGSWEIFMHNLVPVLMSTIHCKDKVINIFKSILLKNKYIRNMQVSILGE